jgi:hypothetical protein
MTAESADDTLGDLRPLQWEKRVLLLFSGNSESRPLLSKLQARDSEIRDRDIAWFVLGESGIATNSEKPLAEPFADLIKERYFSGNDGLEVVLIGKDGGVKGRYQELDLTAIFTRIDSMPMRQAEMRRQQENP